MQTLKVAILTDHALVPRFGLEALDELQGCASITVFSCTNTRLKRRPSRHLAYYLLNLFSIRNPLTRVVPVAQSHKSVDREVRFESRYKGAWQELPEDVVDELASSGFDVIIKFGMGLLIVPPSERLRIPILSFHHGDPDAYRGRPAGFWEMLHGRPTVGQIVQILSNELDAGKVVAFAETKVHPHSYRRTLLEAYRQSPFLINVAVRNALNGVALDKSSKGRNYRLPSNRTVAKFLALMTAAFVKRLFYGAFAEKSWKVSHAPAEDAEALAKGGGFPPANSWETLPVPAEYVFYADPFFAPNGEGILVEALSRRRAVGEIVLVSNEGHRRISGERGHFSYPATFREEGEALLIPEIAQWSPLKAYRLASGGMVVAKDLRVADNARVLDPTMIMHEGRVYLFGNASEIGSNTLFLWSAARLDEEFVPHPMNPIRISPRGARMAGALIRNEGRLIRLGQSFLGDYGDGIFAFEVTSLDPDTYAEKMIGTIKFADRKGPHTLNYDRGRMVFDWYRERFSFLAGVRRLIAKLRR